MTGLIIGQKLIFQSTPSVGRATEKLEATVKNLIFQSTPSVGRATVIPPVMCSRPFLFQSTPSVGRATQLSTVFSYV